MYLTHGQSAWFQEKYSAEPRFQALRKRVNREGRVPTVEKYVAELREGKWDEVTFEDNGEFLDTALTVRISTKAASAAARASRGGGSNKDHDEPEGLDRALGDHHSADDALRMEIHPEGKQVFVKTVPPTTRRVDLEEV